MPITWLDILLLGVMLVSGLLAMIRGFMREILSITAWAAAAVATLLAYPRLLPIAKANISSDIVATGAVIGGGVPDHPPDRLDNHRPHLRHGARQPGSARSTARSASCSGSAAA